MEISIVSLNKKIFFLFLQEYLKKSPESRPNNVPIYVIKHPNKEPIEFTRHFFGWQDNNVNDVNIIL